MRRSPGCRSTRASGHSDASRSTYPACIAFRAAAEQGPEAAAAATCASCARASCATAGSLTGRRRSWRRRAAPASTSQRFRIDLESNAILEAFGSDLEETRTIPDAAREAGLATEGSHGSNVERLAFPALRLIPEATAPRSAGWAATTPTRTGARPRSRRAPPRATGRLPTWRGRCAASAAWPRRARGGLRPARAARRGGGVAPRERMASAARAGAGSELWEPA